MVAPKLPWKGGRVEGGGPLEVAVERVNSSVRLWEPDRAVGGPSRLLGKLMLR